MTLCELPDRRQLGAFAQAALVDLAAQALDDLCHERKGCLGIEGQHEEDGVLVTHPAQCTHK
jgi:hypothetical protein